jgi:hypothetical protein
MDKGREINPTKSRTIEKVFPSAQIGHAFSKSEYHIGNFLLRNDDKNRSESKIKFNKKKIGLSFIGYLRRCQEL